ncbi:hypothetical protein NDN08_000504 [Rhodosorus marinus]|uniref:TLC domain-containing protein n=1 Tax=Rhodosorus marinus TaxID=101924 RepID=A0AAV8UQW1_9RHOD|nr:hypothetical protein NDN08_000504 [Rhodosorus marinus]
MGMDLAVHKVQPTLYMLVLFLFIGITSTQMLWSPDRDDRPANNFGGNFVFLTVQTNFIILLYLCLCVVDYMLGKQVRVFAGMVERLSGLVCTLGILMGGMYYAVVHFDPMTRDRAAQVEDFDFYMHFLHGPALVFAVYEVLFREKAERGPVSDILATEGYMVFFASWSLLCAKINDGWWPYGFQQSMKIWEHIAFNLVFAVFLIPLVSLGVWYVQGRGVQVIRKRRSLGVNSPSQTQLRKVYFGEDPVESSIEVFPHWF